MGFTFKLEQTIWTKKLGLTHKLWDAMEQSNGLVTLEPSMIQLHDKPTIVTG